MSNNDNFFDMFKDSLEGYSPEVSASVHSGLRSKMRVNNFFRFSISSLNIWTILAFTALGGGLLYGSIDTDFSEAKQIEFPTTSNQIASRVVVPSVENPAPITTMSIEKIVPKNENSKSTFTDRNKISKTTKNTSSSTLYSSTHNETIKKDDAKTIKLDESPKPIAIINPDLKKEEIQVTENITPCETVHVKNNSFNGKINFDKFQTASTGLNTELKNNTKKKFTIKIKVPK